MSLAVEICVTRMKNLGQNEEARRKPPFRKKGRVGCCSAAMVFSLDVRILVFSLVPGRCLVGSPLWLRMSVDAETASQQALLMWYALDRVEGLGGELDLPSLYIDIISVRPVAAVSWMVKHSPNRLGPVISSRKLRKADGPFNGSNCAPFWIENCRWWAHALSCKTVKGQCRSTCAQRS
jgi:hypothetical protein